ncbi:MASE1 domain-containing protein [Bradyrhizobium sp. ISRA443]|uniref:MASE1 domain-containing protein n=1 Tax=unclassified Bradyrhizobium TaxID=2631580 RepID=UPI00247A3706|nr:MULTISPECIES: MASE1 domain-containing protein [unclassified Bradyrhizobium]WGS02548.1 MASE1 domain-containing protein [Bradyrhizobium sp. ISRA436]WGS09433.1 MASE1 domain-containing protein [Bradyrhizobium sp. ISRA437]WGS16322.1 MASE1 domain-containing protein [Bradyrhizobium sp. ISRA443]
MESATLDKADIFALGSARSAATYLVELLIVAAIYGALAACASFLPAINPAATPLWPPTGLALALVMLRGYRIWPAILAGAASPHLMADRSILEFGCVGIGTVLAALAGTWLIGRWSNGQQTFSTPSGIAKFAIISFAPTTIISSSIALAGFIFANEPGLSDSVVTWLTWWLADAAGTLVIAPIVVLWATMPSRSSFERNLLELIAVSAVVSIIGIVAYSPLIGSDLIGNDLNVLLPYRSLLGFLVLLPLMWAGLRGNRCNVATAALVFVGTAVWGFSAGDDPFPKTDLNGALLSLLVLSISVSVPPLALAAAIATHQATEAHLRSVQDQLYRQVERKALALDSVRRHFQSLIEGVVDYAIFALDKEGHVTSWNSTAQKIIGYTPEEIIGKHFGIFYRPDERRAGSPSHALESAIQEGKHEVEGWRIRKNGTPFFITGSVSSSRDASGNLIGFISILRDATERRDAEEKLVQAREQLAMSQKMEAIGKLTGGIAHDFNNLLMIIGGSAQIFTRLLDPKLPRAIEAIQTAAKRGESLTRQLLTFSRHQHLSPTVVDLNASIKNMRTMIESSLRGNIVYNENIGEGVSPVKVDLAELELAIVNIAVNARDAMTNGGTFTLSLHAVTVDQETGGDRRGKAFFAIALSDTGTGIPPNLLSKMFDPFFTTKEVGKGTGLGLSQVYGFAHQAGGTVTADSKVGQGTTITIFLPSCADEQIASKGLAAARTRARHPQRQTVLVVDDSADVADVTSSLFEHLGYDTIYRDSAEAALKLLEAGTKIDLVFSDIVMPGTIDGVGLAREIRSRYPHLPVALTTGYSDAAKAAPPNLRILRKPFDTEALRDFIQDIAPPRSMRSSGVPLG